MASSASPLSLLFFIFISAATTLPLGHSSSDMILTLVNNCRYPIWPAIQPNAGHPVLEGGGFFLPALSHRSFPAPAAHWSGRVWARTACHHINNHFSCATGDCGNRVDCAGAGGKPPATLAQFVLRHGHDAALSSYGVSLVDGFNIPLTITPHEGHGVCPVVGCKADLLATCPPNLRLESHRGHVVGCKSGCEAYNTDELCCRNHYNSPQTCRASSYSDFFKRACPSTFTFAHDTPSLMHDCSSPRELKVIFCH